MLSVVVYYAVLYIEKEPCLGGCWIEYMERKVRLEGSKEGRSII
jgi:hypothetical protein